MDSHRMIQERLAEMVTFVQKLQETGDLAIWQMQISEVGARRAHSGKGRDLDALIRVTEYLVFR